MNTPYEELVELLADRPREAFLVVGSGVSLASTRGALVASWRGLLEHGIAYCESQLGLKTDWVSTRRLQLEIGEYVQVAGEISERLGAPKGGRYAEWLEKTIGSLQLVEPRLVNALHRWGVNIATTNYDVLLERSEFIPITWQDRARHAQFIRGQCREILHLHGVYRDPGSVIFDSHSYDRVREDRPIQTLMRTLCQARTPVFVGCGRDGMDDPNIGALVQWCREELKELVCPGYLIAQGTELDAWKTLLDSSQIRLISYGDTHSEFPVFLERVADEISRRRSALRPADLLEPLQEGFDEAMNSVIPGGSPPDPAESIREIIRQAKLHWEAGGKRTAWMTISGHLEQAKAILPSEEWLQYVLDLSEMQLADDAQDRAFRKLHEVASLVEFGQISPAIRDRYWRLRARCLEVIGFYADAREILDKAIAAVQDPAVRARLQADDRKSCSSRPMIRSRKMTWKTSTRRRWSALKHFYWSRSRLRLATPSSNCV